MFESDRLDRSLSPPAFGEFDCWEDSAIATPGRKNRPRVECWLKLALRSGAPMHFARVVEGWKAILTADRPPEGEAQ
jgi:hypothetical protein